MAMVVKLKQMEDKATIELTFEYAKENSKLNLKLCQKLE